MDADKEPRDNAGQVRASTCAGGGMTNDELQRAINEAVRAAVIAPASTRFMVDMHLNNLLSIQLERTRDAPTTQEPAFQFSRGQCLQSDLDNACALLRQCGFKNVTIYSSGMASK